MQVIVIGLGRFGHRLAVDLASRGAEVIAADLDPRLVDAIKDRVTVAVTLEGTDEKALRKIGVQDVDTAVVAIGKNIEAAIMTTAVLRRMGVAQIVSRATTPLQAEILREVGAKRVILLEESMGQQLAREILEPGVRERIKLSSGHHLIEIRVPRPLVGKTLGELELRRRMGVNVIAIQSRVPVLEEDGSSSYQTRINDVPGPGDRLEADDTLVVVGGEAELAKLAEEATRTEKDELS